MTNMSYLNKIQRAVLYIIFTLPLLVVPFTIFPHHFAKVTVFLLTVGVGMGVWLFDVWKTKRYQSGSHSLFKPFVLWLAVMVVASLLGENFSRSLGGVYFRNTGLILWLALFGFFILLNQTFKEKLAWGKALIYFVSVGLVVAFVGIVQRFMTVWPGLIDQSGRVGSTIGNPIFLAAYLLIVLFVNLYVAATAAHIRQKWIWSVLCLVPLLAIYFTESAGAFVGLALGLMVMAAVIVIRSKQRKMIVGAIICLIIMAGGGLLFLKYRNFLLKSPLEKWLSPLSRLSYISLNSATADTRRMAWDMGIQGLKARPIFGWGVGNFETVADRYYNPKFLEYSFAETVWDTPHNIFIQIASETGLVGLAIFLSLLIVAFLSLYRNNKYSTLEKSILTGALVAYLAQDLFGVDTVSSLIGFILILSLVDASRPVADKKVSEMMAALTWVAVGSLAVAIWFWVIIPFRVSIYLNNADRAQIYGNNGEAFEKNALVALNYHGMYAGDFSLALARNILNWDGTNNLPYLDLKKGFLTLVASIEQAAKDHPDHFNYHYYLGQLYQILAERGEKNYFQLAEKELFRARELSPDRQVVSFMLGKNYFLSGQLDKAAVELKKMIILYPRNPEAHLYYGLILVSMGQTPQGVAELLQLAKVDYKGDNLDFINQIGLIMSDNKDYKDLLSFYEFYIAYHPDNKLMMARLAEAQYLAGEKTAAEATVLKLKQETDAAGSIDLQWNTFKKTHQIVK